MRATIAKDLPFDGLKHFTKGTKVEVIGKYKCAKGIKYEVVNEEGFKEIIDIEYMEDVEW